MFEHGLESLHIKKPGFSKKQLKKYIDLIPLKHHNKIIIHSHYSLAFKYNVKGLHLSSSFRNTNFFYKKYISLYKIIKPKLIDELGLVYSTSISQCLSWVISPIIVDVYIFPLPNTPCLVFSMEGN